MTDKKKLRNCTLDIETDPFLHGRTPLPFCIGFYDGEDYWDFWGDDCIQQMIDFLAEYPEPCRIYVHNGGGFDFWYLFHEITNPVFFINKRIAKCGFLGQHELRDSYRMIPVSLDKFAKEKIDYRKFERSVREKHKKEILRYLFLDCKYLHDMVTQFIESHGDHLTIGSAAYKKLRSMHPVQSESQYFDKLFRPYYMGGRVECFKTGEIKGDLKIYDVNSMYPKAMRDFEHPRGNQYMIRGSLPDNDSFYFAKIIAVSKGALPIKAVTKSGFATGLHFPHGENEFLACSHEINMARELGLLKIKRVIECRQWRETQRFSDYVDHFMGEKISAEKEGDKGKREFSKLMLNSPYGKFGQDPSKYRDCQIFECIEEAIEAGFQICESFGDRFIGERPAELKPWSYKNVAIAASITSASRAMLMDGIARAKGLAYCDTDSLICERLDAELDATKLGAWKLEAEGDRVFIAGKKLYSFWDGDKCVKKASKGVNLSGELIAQVATSDHAISVPIDAPTLRVGEKAKFIKRNIRRTIDRSATA